MKAKSLVVLLIIVGVLVLYSIVCYDLVNRRVEVGTRNAIANYFSIHAPQVESYEYLKAVGDAKYSFRIFVKTEEDYYTFYFDMNQETYQLMNVETDAPNYIHS